MLSIQVLWKEQKYVIFKAWITWEEQSIHFTIKDGQKFFNIFMEIVY